jgi:hypothetical protein
VEIAAALGTDRKSARNYRLRLGLPSRWDRAADAKARVAAGWLAHRDRVLAARRAELAARYGLPADLPPAQVRVVLALAGGPLPAAALADRCGRADRPCYPTPFHRFNCRVVPGRNHLSALVRRGLVARTEVTRGKGNGRGRGPGVYLLTAAAMDLLTAKEPT